MLPINYWAVLVAAAASVVLGFLWYGPIFGKQWMTLTGMTKEKAEADKQKGMAGSYALLIIGSLLTAYVLANTILFGIDYLMIYGVSGGLQGSFWSWLGFVAPVTLSPVLWEGKPWKLWLLNNGYYLLSFLIMGAILGGWTV